MTLFLRELSSWRRHSTEPYRDAETLHGELHAPSLSVHVPTVNEPYPGVTREVPPVILERLPPLSEHVEYRIAGHDLLLWDVHADIVVDFHP